MTNPIYKEIEYKGTETAEKLGFKIIKEVFVEKTYKFGYLIKETKFRRTAEVNGHYENKSVPQYEYINSSLYSEKIDSLEEASERISAELGNLKSIATCRYWTSKEYLKFIELRRALGKNKWQIRQFLSPREPNIINNYFLELWAEESGLKYETIKDLAGLEFN